MPNTLQVESTVAQKQDHTSQGSVHLDALRGGAALLVFLNHTRALYYSSALQSFDAKAATPSSSDPVLPTPPGQVAVTTDYGGNEVFSGEIKLASEAVIIFFVLSGYLVGGSVLRSVRKARWSWRSYLIKRLSRLYVVLLPAILLGGLLDFIGVRFLGQQSVYHTPPGIQIVTTFDLIHRLRPAIALGNVAFLQGILVPEFGTNVSMWSLSNEFWYYILFPLLVLAFVAGRNRWIRAGCVVSAVLLTWFIGPAMAVLFPVWMMGALVVLLPQSLTERQAKLGVYASAVFLLLCMAGVRLLHAKVLVADYIIALGASALIFCVAQQKVRARENLYKAVAGFFSRISYSLYLFHLPLAVFLCGLVNTPWRPWHSPAHLAVFVGLELCVLGAVTLLWRLFEANTDAIRGWLFEH